MKILVDADACPVKDIIVREAKKRSIDVIMFIDTSHLLCDGYSQIVTVDKARDSADFALIAKAKAKDIVVTQDFGVAAMALSVGSRPINQNGLVFTADNMDALLNERHISQKIRRSGGHTANHPKRTCEDNKNFEINFLKLLDSLQNDDKM